ncbi:hypothetical protein BH09MYX1_BH09MYX1_13140 [soil metagenome]
MRRVFAIAFGIGLISCGEGSTPTPTGETYIAFGSSFGGYEGWEKFDLAAAEAPQDGGIPLSDAGCPSGHDTSAHRVGYLNKRPPSGSTEFPVGTIIVKEMQKGTSPDTWQIFAMVKRGGGFNPNGAKNWEWFEIKRDPKLPLVVWRGVGPPAGEGYGSPACGGCNSCHGAAASNDYVLSPQFNLKNF